MPWYFRGTFHWCMGTILMLKQIHLMKYRFTITGSKLVTIC
jgi:hypothetical protein